jgi:cadmium resistance protein CadD (predicted permease)
MISNNSQQISSGSYIGVPVTTDISVPPAAQLPASYYYFALLPGLITAITPLFLGLKKKNKDKDEDKGDDE